MYLIALLRRREYICQNVYCLHVWNIYWRTHPTL